MRSPDATRSTAPYSRILLPSFTPLGHPIVAGWAYQFIAQLNFVRESWTAPVDVERVRPAKDANEVAAEQVKVLLGRPQKYRPFPCSSSTPPL